jgi:hypothetical protein
VDWVQLIPPIKASARSQRIGRRRRLSAINARNARSLWDFFMFGMASVFEARGENAMGDDPLQRETTERGKIILGYALWGKVKGWERNW